MDAETWKPVLDHDGFYEVSDQGRVRVLEHYDANRWGGLIFKPTRLLKQRADKDGYFRVSLFLKARPVHQLVLEAFKGRRPEGMMALHADGSRTNNTPDNLSWGTATRNAEDRARHGRTAAGERSPRARLTPELVRSIRIDERSGRKIGADYAISKTHVRRIKRGHCWAGA